MDLRLERHHEPATVLAPTERPVPERIGVRPVGEQHHLHCAMRRSFVAY